MQTATPVRANPYVGPRSFQTGEKIYGRDRELKDLLGLLIAERIVLLHSPSGAGKTSLINAGLIPALQERDFHVLPTMRVSLEPPTEFGTAGNRYVRSLLLSLEEGLPAEQQAAPAELSSLSFDAYLKRYEALKDGPGDLVLIFDQFEEILTIDPTDTEAKAEFFAQVGEALRNQRRRWALFSMREDYVASLSPYLRPLPTRLNTTFHLGLLDYNAARAPIQQPARSQGVEFTDEAARQLIDDLRRVQVQLPNGTVETQSGPAVEPVQLQVVCRRLWDQLGDQVQQITPNELREVGDVNEALAAYYADQVRAIALQLGDEAGAAGRERAIREWFDRQLITPQGVRSQVLQGPEQSGGLSNQSIWSLINAYLVRAEKRRGMNWFELSHDRMINPVRDDNAAWFDRHLSTLQRQADLWNRSGRPDGLLLKNAELLEAESWAQANDAALLEHEHDFLVKCREARTVAARAARQARWIRNLAIGASLLSLIAMAAFVVAMDSYNKAVTQTRFADARGYAARAVGVIGNDPEVAILLGQEAVLKTYAFGLAPEPEALTVLYDATQRSRVRTTLTGETDKWYALSYSPDGSRLAAGGPAGELRIWDLANNSSTTLSGLESDIFALAYSRDGARLAATDLSGAVVVWDLAGSAEELRLSMGEGNLAFALAFSPDGTLLAAAGFDGTARVFDLAARSEQLSLAHDFYLTSLDFSPDGRLLVTGSADGSARVWELPSGREVERFEHDAVVVGVRFNPTGPGIATADDVGMARIWEPASDEPPTVLRNPGGQLQSLAYSPDGRLLATTGVDGVVRIWDLAARVALLELNGHDAAVRGVQFHPDGRRIASAGDDGVIRIWSLDQIYPSGLWAVAGAPDGSLAVGSGDGTIRLVDPQSGDVRSVLRQHSERIYALAFNSDYSRLAAVSDDGTASLWSPANPTPLLVYDKHSDPDAPDNLRAVAFNPVGDLIASGGERGRVHLWRPASGETVNILTLPEDERSVIAGLAFSPSTADRLAMIDQQGGLTLWDTSAGSVVFRKTLDAEPLRVLFSKDGMQLVITTRDGTVELLDAASGAPIDTLSGHKGDVASAALSPNGRYLATGSSDGSLRIWELAGGSLQLVITQPSAPTDLAFSPDGMHLAATSNNGTLRVYPVNTENPLDPEPLLALARQRLTRPPTADECDEYRLDASAGCVAPSLATQ